MGYWCSDSLYCACVARSPYSNRPMVTDMLIGFCVGVGLTSLTQGRDCMRLYMAGLMSGIALGFSVGLTLNWKNKIEKGLHSVPTSVECIADGDKNEIAQSVACLTLISEKK